MLSYHFDRKNDTDSKTLKQEGYKQCDSDAEQGTRLVSALDNYIVTYSVLLSYVTISILNAVNHFV